VKALDKEWKKYRKEKGLDLYGKENTEQTEPSKTAAQQLNRIKKKEIGRNTPCPCGSGKKYKNAVLFKGIKTDYNGFGGGLL